MYYRTRPQSPRGVNRTAGIWQGLQRWMLKTHHNHQFYPSRFHLRGFSIALLIAIPAMLWIRASLWSSQDPVQNWSRGACPPQHPISVQEVVRSPERFQEQPVWVMGQPSIYKKQCFSNLCPKEQKVCCVPCMSRLALQQQTFILPLKGWIPNPKGQPLRLGCRGTTCKFACNPIKSGTTYAFYGRPLTTLKTQKPYGRPTFTLRHFQVMRFCPINTRGVWRSSRPKLKDPLYRRRKVRRKPTKQR